MSEAELVDLDGVPAYVGDEDAPLVVGMTVRVGMSDEQLPIHGVSHMTEHLTLVDAPLGYNCNGFVDMQTTNFVVQGTDDEVIRFFNAVCGRIARPAYDRIPTEAQILQTESAGKSGGGVLSWSLHHRIGPRNYGLRQYREFFFDHPSAHTVHQWLSRYFNRGNVCLWSNRPLPEGLWIPLVEGPRAETVAPTWLDEEYPIHAPGPEGAVAATFVLEWSTPAVLVLLSLREHLFRTLRTQHGLSYSVQFDMESLAGGRLLHAAIWADGLPANLQRVLEIMIAEVERVARHGPPADVLAQCTKLLTKTPEGADPHARARAHLFGIEHRSHEQVKAEVLAATPSSLAAILHPALSSVMWLVPEPVVWTDTRFKPLRPWSREQVEGRTIKPAKLNGKRPKSKLVVAADGVTMTLESPEQRVTIRYDDLAAYLMYDDGRRTFIGNDGFIMRVNPQEWPDFGRLAGRIDLAIPEGLAIRIPES